MGRNALPSRDPLARLGGLVVACHPLPCVAVTGFAAAYGWSVGLSGRTLLGLAATVLSGQLAIGWTNDVLDAGRDAAAGRRDKPLARGVVPVLWVVIAAVTAAMACVPLSLRLGVVPGLIHLFAVGSALGYNAGIKATPLSPLPYLVSFGLLPAVATTAREVGGWPPAGVVAAGSLLGIGAHFANTVGDVEADRLTGVRGLPQRLGPRWSLVVTALAVALAASAVLAAPGHRTPTGVALLTMGAALAGAVALIPTARAGRRTAFRLVVGAVGLVIAGLLASS